VSWHGRGCYGQKVSLMAYSLCSQCQETLQYVIRLPGRGSLPGNGEPQLSVSRFLFLIKLSISVIA
jgi:hypothetical protein